MKKIKNGKQILALLYYLKTVGIPCTMNLTCIDENKQVVKGKINIPIDLDDLPMDILNGDENYLLLVQVSNLIISLENHDPSHDQQYFEGVIQKISEISVEYIINWDRKRKLKDILGDPNPPSQVPV
jgi:hypothetical protein